MRSAFNIFGNCQTNKHKFRTNLVIGRRKHERPLWTNDSARRKISTEAETKCLFAGSSGYLCCFLYLFFFSKYLELLIKSWSRKLGTKNATSLACDRVRCFESLGKYRAKYVHLACKDQMSMFSRKGRSYYILQSQPGKRGGGGGSF